jgi:hypothetical protein
VCQHDDWAVFTAALGIRRSLLKGVRLAKCRTAALSPMAMLGPETDLVTLLQLRESAQPALVPSLVPMA